MDEKFRPSAPLIVIHPNFQLGQEHQQVLVASLPPPTWARIQRHPLSLQITLPY